jgi:molecular chaperone GrpE (heat shock protein)
MKGWIIAVSTLCVSVTVAFAYTATLDDFKEAVKHTGCESIPYSDLRSDCKSKASDRDEWCKSKGKFTCEDLDPRGLQQQIDNISDKVKELKSQRDDLKSKRSDAKDDDERKKLDDQIAAIGEQIDKLEKKIDDMKHKLDEEKHQIEDRIYIGQHCLDARADVQDKFDRARSAADSESDEAIKPIARQLIDLWNKGSDDHKKITADTKTAVEQCKNFR